MSDISTRPLTGFDVALLAELHPAIFTAPWDQPWSARSFAEILSMPGARGWLLAECGDPIGFILARFTLDEGEILLTGILPEAQRHGYGARLLKIVMDAARDAGVARLFLEHAANNDGAGKLYAKFGFAECGRRNAYYQGAAGKREDAITRTRNLD